MLDLLENSCRDVFLPKNAQRAVSQLRSKELILLDQCLYTVDSFPSLDSYDNKRLGSLELLTMHSCICLTFSCYTWKELMFLSSRKIVVLHCNATVMDGKKVCVILASDLIHSVALNVLSWIEHVHAVHVSSLYYAEIWFVSHSALLVIEQEMSLACQEIHVHLPQKATQSFWMLKQKVVNTKDQFKPTCHNKAPYHTPINTHLCTDWGKC